MDIFSISNKTNPSLVSTIDYNTIYSSSASWIESIETPSASSLYLYIALTNVGVLILDNSSPSNPTVVTRVWTDPSGLNTNGVYGLDVSGRYMVAGDDESITLYADSVTDSVSVTVNAPALPPSATISGANCIISAGAGTCTTEIDWHFDYVTSPSVHRLANAVDPAAQISTSLDGVDVEVSIPIGQTTFEAREGSIIPALDSVTLTAGCADTHFWHATDLECGVLPTISIQAEPNIIRAGNTADINVTIDSEYTFSCELYGATDSPSSPLPFNHTGGIIPATYNELTDSLVTRPLKSAQEVIVVCDILGDDSVVVTATGRVDVIGTQQEI